MTRSPLTTHVLDTARGRPAAGIPIRLEVARDGDFVEVARGTTDDDGRAPTLVATGWDAGIWRLTFDTQAYFTATGTEGFYPEVQVVFRVIDPEGHHHVPLLLSPFGYSTYRGS